MPDKLVDIKQAAIRDGVFLLVVKDPDGAERTLYLTPQHQAPGDGIQYPREPAPPGKRAPALRRRT